MQKIIVADLLNVRTASRCQIFMGINIVYLNDFSSLFGIPKNRVILLPYIGEWADEYSRVKELFMELFADEIVLIEHVGSILQVFHKMKQSKYYLL